MESYNTRQKDELPSGQQKERSVSGTDRKNSEEETVSPNKWGEGGGEPKRAARKVKEKRRKVKKSKKRGRSDTNATQTLKTHKGARTQKQRRRRRHLLRRLDKLSGHRGGFKSAARRLTLKGEGSISSDCGLLRLQKGRKSIAKQIQERKRTKIIDWQGERAPGTVPRKNSRRARIREKEDELVRRDL